ncbi:hypothetical protein CVT26_012028 [Gymnopilus dilepis]|uniref:Vacuolar membrane protease C-terminal domain-containing protein n=1 Tax=Gymnopilus dilepis TaxID=231916 RepID=A0A409YHT6_9AGAR|nr:hypothetical protein CVT26_012028 [Gymnopilus dilepis]
MWPWHGRIHGWLTSVVFLVFVVSTVYSWAVFPFSKEEPLKVFFQQRIEVDLSSSTSSNKVVKSTTSLTGAPQFIGELIIPALPSSWSSDVHCATAILPALSTCSWESPLLPYPVNLQDDSSQPPHWLSVKATKTSPTSAFFSVNGTNTRSCRIYFDNRPIKSFQVHEVLPDGTTVIPGDNMRKAFPIPAGGVNIVTLWSRTWDRTFDVEVYWDAPSSANGISVNDAKDEPDASSLSGRVACEWAEYESGTLGFKGLQADPTGAIPAYEETLMYLPEWAVATKIGDGLAEVFTRFDLS